MFRKGKVMGLALVAVLATSAIVASSASAQFEAESAPVKLTVSSNEMQKLAFSSGGTNFECTTLAITGSLASTPATELTVLPTYSNCEKFLGQAIGVVTNGCVYVFHIAAGATKGTTDISCPTGKTIEFTIGSICKYTIGSQTGLGSVSFSNLGTGTTREVKFEPNVTGITSTRVTNDLLCPAGGSTGTYVGNSIVTGSNPTSSVHIGVFMD